MRRHQGPPDRRSSAAHAVVVSVDPETGVQETTGPGSATSVFVTTTLSAAALLSFGARLFLQGAVLAGEIGAADWLG